MEQATNLSDVLQIQNRLTDVIYQIESYESRLRTYDNLIDFTTIDLTIREVEVDGVINVKDDELSYSDMNIGGMSNSSDGSTQSLYANNEVNKVISIDVYLKVKAKIKGIETKAGICNWYIK